MSEGMIACRQVLALTRANLKCRYRKTFAGFLWVVLHPLTTFGVQALVFGHFLKIDVQNYFLFLVSGLVPWIFISQTLEMSASIFVNSGQMIKSYPPSPLIYLATQVADNLINFVAGFVIALFPLWYYESGIPWRALLLPLPIVVLTIGVFGLGLRIGPALSRRPTSRPPTPARKPTAVPRRVAPKISSCARPPIS